MGLATVQDRYSDEQISRFYDEGLWRSDTFFSIIDQQAAALILQGWLDAQRARG